MLITQYTKGLGDSTYRQVYEAAGTKEYFDKVGHSAAQRTELVLAALQENERECPGLRDGSLCLCAPDLVLILKSWDTILCW